MMISDGDGEADHPEVPIWLNKCKEALVESERPADVVEVALDKHDDVVIGANLYDPKRQQSATVQSVSADGETVLVVWCVPVNPSGHPPIVPHARYLVVK